MKRIAMLALALAAATTTACTENIFTTAPEVKADTTPSVQLPAFSIQNFVVTPGETLFGQTISFYAPSNFKPVITATSNSNAVAQVVNSGQFETQNTADSRTIWTIWVNFKVTGLGSSQITVELKNVPGQTSSFTVIGTNDNQKG